MTRMSREFTLVLLGAGLLTAGYIAWPEPDLDKSAEASAAKRVGANDGTTRRSGGGGMLIFIGHTGGGGSSASGGARAGMASVSKGGMGGIGRGVSSSGGGGG